MNFKNMNESAVSPIVATLVLIVVAVVGAVAVGTIIGAFSSDVSEQVNPGDVAGASSAEILIAGSTTVQPASELLAKAYMNAHPGVKVTVQGGGSDAGIASAFMGIADIGAASKAVPDDAKYADLQTHQIGGSAVVVVTSDSTVKNMTSGMLEQAYRLADADGKVTLTVAGNGNVTGVAAGGPTTLFQRAEGSGTEETFAEWLGGDYKTAKNVDASKAAGKTGNAGVLAAVKSTADSIGFVDYGFAVAADKADGVQIVGLSSAATHNDDTVYTASIGAGESASTLKTQIKNSLKGTAKFPLDTVTGDKELSRPLNYITSGSPNSVVKNYIEFAQSPGAKDLINDAGMFSIIEFV